MRILCAFFTLLLFASCTEVASNRQMSSGQGVSGGGDPVSGGGNGAIPGGDGIDPDSVEEIEAKVEIRHLVEPKIDDARPGGTYTRKLTIPKDFDGHLYLAGINVATLAEKNLKVRFKFGVDRNPIDIPATLATAPGLIPQTNVEVLVMDLRSQPFSRTRLIYDLFDYNEYDFGAGDPDPGVLAEPVQYNRDDKLFCRGLRLEDDPTFTGQLSQGCSDADDICKYSYAKVTDKGLVKDNWIQPILPTEINVASAGLSMGEDDNATNLERCLPDNPPAASHTIGSTTFPFSAYFDSDPSEMEWKIQPGSLTPLMEGSSLLGNYYYQGPYQATNLNEWQISNAALLGEYGVFGDFLKLNTGPDVGPVIDNMELQFGIQSKLFPLQTRMELGKDVEYMGSAVPGGEKELKTMGSNGESQWMDGCNARVSTMLNDYNGEHVGACNVTAKIEIIAVDDEGNEQVVDVTDEVKLQLVKEESLDSSGENVILSSYQACSSSSQCGADSCCIGGRCWSKSLVSQCVEDIPSYGSKVPGDSCQSDNECSSLCCNQATGKCAVHDTLSEPEVLCSKPSGQSCIADEWCMQHPVTECYIVNTGYDAQGQRTCALRCYTYEKHGDCKASAGSAVGVCVPPEQPEQPVFNPSDPNRCDEAINPDQVPVSNL